MSEEEKKSIEELKDISNYCNGMNCDLEDYDSYDFNRDELDKLSIVLNLIEKQVKEIVNRDKIIDKMAEELRYQNGMQQDDIFCVDICKGEKCNKEQCKDKIKQYFINKVEEK